MSALTLFLKTLTTALLASLAHEGTHYLVARVLRRRPQFALREWAVFWHAPDHAPTPGDWAIAAAPLGIGLVAGGVLVGVGAPWWVVPGWYLYTLHGAITNDFDFDAVKSAKVAD